jgi:hypothetical protein
VLLRPRTLAPLVLAASASACARAPALDDDRADAAAPAADDRPASGAASAVVAALARAPLFAAPLAHAIDPAALPARADLAVRVVTRRGAVDVETLDAAPSAAVDVDRVRVHHDVAPSTDLARVALRGGVEEIRWLRDPRAPTSFRQRLRVPEGAAVRMREGHVEVVAADGYVELASAPMKAVDARGVVRALEVSLDAGAGADAVVEARLDTEGLAWPIAIDPLWSTTATVASAHSGGVLVSIGGRRALYAGGFPASGTGAVGTTDLYDAATNTWTSVGAMKTPRSFPAGVQLTASGDVLACGGSDAGGAASGVCERFSTTTRTWSAAATMNVARQQLHLVGYAAGAKALLVDPTTASFSYDAMANAWSAIASPIPTPPRYAPMLLTLPDGRIMVAGGGDLGPPTVSSTTNAAVSLFTPSTNSWAAGAPMASRRFGGAAVVLGNVVVAAGGTAVCGVMSGFTFCSTLTAELYNPGSNTWTSIPGVARMPLVAYALSGGLGFFFLNAGTWEYATYTAPSTVNWTIAGIDAPPSEPSVQISPREVLFVGGGGVTNVLFALGVDGAPCERDHECATNHCAGGACCETATCPAGSVCNAPLHPGTCGKLLGNACAANAECDSGSCVDGVCCDSACGGQCQACDVPGKAGTCTSVFGAPHGKRAACAGAGSSDPCVVEACDGSDAAACHFPGGGVPCGAASCASGVETHGGACDGGGKCSVTSSACGVYVCDAKACKSSCTATSDCIAGFYCDTAKSACVPLTNLGAACDATHPCTAGLSCTDGVCCGKASCGSGASCAVAGKEGACFILPGYACAADGQCGSGHCVDGVCCPVACDGQCEACDVAGSVGACTPVKGKPHGARSACASDPAHACAQAVCDGTSRTTCGGKVASEVVCRAAACANGSATVRATCDGAGACPDAITTSCDGYRCNDDGLTCLALCGKDADCVDGYACVAGKCTKRTASCASDGASVIGADGTHQDCAPFRCQAGACLWQCATSDDCAAGLTCDVASKQCVAAPTQGSGGCAVRDDGGGGSGGGGAMGAVLAMFACALAGLVSRRRS